MSWLSQLSWTVCVKGMLGRRYLSDHIGFALKKSRLLLPQQMHTLEERRY